MKDFFADPTFQKQLRLAVDQAREHMQTIDSPTQVHLGDAYMFAETIELPVRWIVVAEHNHTPELCYLIAADELAMVGATDVELREPNAMAPLVLRCGVGFWAHRCDVRLDLFVGRVDNDVVAVVQQRLSQMEHGNLPTANNCDGALDEDYVDWISELVDYVKQIEQRIQAVPVVLPSSVATHPRDDFAMVAEHRAAYAVTDIAATPKFSETSDVSEIIGAFPGKLIVQKIGQVFELIYAPSVQEAPPPLADANGLNVEKSNWVLQANGNWRWSQFLTPTNGKLTLAIGNEKFEIAH